MNGSSQTIRTAAVPAAVAALTVAAAAAWWTIAARIPFWYDEAHTYALTREGVGGVLRLVLNDSHPPGYFLIAALAGGGYGATELALRAPSVIASALTLVVLAAAARVFLPAWTGLLAAGLAAASPMVLRYAVEARGYALLTLLLAATTWLLLRLSQRATRRDLVALAVVLALGLQVHNGVVFVLPSLLLAAALAGGRALALRVLLCIVVAAIPYAPWFYIAATNDIVSWIDEFWQQQRWGALPSSIGALTGTATFPGYVFGDVVRPTLPWVGVALAVAALAAGIAPAVRARRMTDARVSLAVLAFGPLVTLWTYSWLGQPVYLVGRYDILALPAMLLLLVAGVEALVARARVAGAVVGIGLLLAAGGASLAGADVLRARCHSDLVGALQTMAWAHEGDTVLASGTTYVLTRYLFERYATPLTLEPWPNVVRDRPGWYNETLLLREPDALRADAEQVRARLLEAAARGDVWHLDGTLGRTGGILSAALSPAFEVDDDWRAPPLGLARLVPRARDAEIPGSDGRRALGPLACSWTCCTPTAR